MRYRQSESYCQRLQTRLYFDNDLALEKKLLFKHLVLSA